MIKFLHEKNTHRSAYPCVVILQKKRQMPNDRAVAHRFYTPPAAAQDWLMLPRGLKRLLSRGEGVVWSFPWLSCDGMCRVQ
jgi:hypothetical protein